MSLATAYRTHTCGELRASDAGSKASLAGWVHRRRDQGGLIFLDLRDRHGLTQVVIDQATAADAHGVASDVRNEYVVQARGTVAKRPAGTDNPKLPTGEVELRVSELRVLSEAKTPPFLPSEAEFSVDEALRLRYRYLDLRRPEMQARLRLRSELVAAIHTAHDARGFTEIETPSLVKSTPEGARDFIVPSRLQPGNIYALPQSPQQLKQLLMVSGSDRYYQIARCFRDEDLRGDRQPEFTQLDLEMSFVAEEDVMAFVEAMVTEVSQQVVPERPIVQSPFPRFTFEEALERYGTDKPDLRFALELVDLADAVGGSGYRVFEDVLGAAGRVIGLVVPGGSSTPRSKLDEYEELAKRNGAKGLVWIAVEEAGEGAVRSTIARAVGENRTEAIAVAAGASPGDLVLIVADVAEAREIMGRVRVELGRRLRLIDPNVLSYAWVHQFPMYQWDADLHRWDATHNPFSAPLPEDEPLLVTASGDPLRPSPQDPAGEARAQQYDVVLNGWELGGGSVRIHRRELLERSFALMGHTIEGMRDRFGALLDSFEYGAPPHGGIAIGIDRWAALLTNQDNIREVMAFPKTQSGSDLMLAAPSPADPEQLAELHLRFEPPKTP
jgi:aspartyl-tRNA synthetase